ncbi:adenosylcobinamide-GDP ribazoletransferase [Methanococcus sp. CF]
MIDELKGLVLFMTRIPIGMSKSGFEDIARYFMFMPLVGTLISLFGVFTACLLNYVGITSGNIIGTAVLFTLLYIQGFHHLDGLADYGDAWMVTGNARKKLEVMKDVYMGIGGFVFVFFVELLSLFSYAYLFETSEFTVFLKYIIIIETCSRLGLLSCACCGIPANEGTGRYFAKTSNESHLLTGLIFALGVSIVLQIPKIGVLCSILAVFLGMFIAWKCNNKLGCVTGDIFGATAEISRMVFLIVIIAVTPYISHIL